MSEWIVEIDYWSIKVDAEDEGDALCRADMAFSLMNESRVHKTEDEEDSE